MTPSQIPTAHLGTIHGTPTCHTQCLKMAALNFRGEGGIYIFSKNTTRDDVSILLVLNIGRAATSHGIYHNGWKLKWRVPSIQQETRWVHFAEKLTQQQPALQSPLNSLCQDWKSLRKKCHQSKCHFNHHSLNDSLVIAILSSMENYHDAIFASSEDFPTFNYTSPQKNYV